MTTESTAGDGDQTKNAGGSTPDVAKLQEQLQAVIVERDTFKGKLRDLEKTAKGASDLQKQLEDTLANSSKLQQEFETFKQTVKQEKLTTNLQTALEAAGAKSAKTVLKLLDQASIKFKEDGSVDETSVAEAIGAVKKSDPYLFKEELGNDGQGAAKSTPDTTNSLPGVKPAAHSQSKSAFEAELEAARKDKKDPFKAIERVLEKYGKR